MGMKTLLEEAWEKYAAEHCSDLNVTWRVELRKGRLREVFEAGWEACDEAHMDAAPEPPFPSD
jgi:hypothetical protein